MSFELPPLPYQFKDLEPFIDAQTVEIHYTKHHATYLKNLNTALEKYPELANWSIESLLKGLDQIPEEIRVPVRNNGGGFFNHNLYWQNMGPKCGGEPTEPVSKAITDAFGDFTTFKTEFEKTGLGRLGSGYAWLSLKPDHTLLIHSTLNQDSPLADGLAPLLVVDVWEHAYYLKYQNRRAEYLTAWWNLVNWKEVERRYETLV
jgi:superoxide dismutase, Fe-Mn family